MIGNEPTVPASLLQVVTSSDADLAREIKAQDDSIEVAVSEAELKSQIDKVVNVVILVTTPLQLPLLLLSPPHARSWTDYTVWYSVGDV